MNRQQLLKRSSIALLATTALLVTAFLFACITTTQLKQAYADNSEINGAVQIIEDDHAIACIKERGYGYILLYDSFGYYNKNHKLTEIAGIPLKDIIHFEKNDGYVSEFWTETINSTLYDYSVNVTAYGPDIYPMRCGFLYFTDDSNDTYSLHIFRGKEKSHHVKYNSNKPRIAKIEWHGGSIM